jgi:hypothetical protein
MALFPLGILSAAGAGRGFSSDYELIETQILGSSTPSITFSNLGTYSSTYKHLQIRAVARTNFASNDLWSKISINGSEANRYHRLSGNGSTVASTEFAIGYVALFPAANGTTNSFGGAVIDILDPYSTTKNKTIRSIHGFTGVSNWVLLSSALRIDTASTTSITLTADSTGSFVSGSRFSLYGIR